MIYPMLSTQGVRLATTSVKLLTLSRRHLRLATVVRQVAEAAEVRKLESARRRAFAQRDAQLQQLEELKSRILSERAQDRQEGEILKMKAQEEVRRDRCSCGATVAYSKAGTSGGPSKWHVQRRRRGICDNDLKRGLGL